MLKSNHDSQYVKIVAKLLSFILVFCLLSSKTLSEELDNREGAIQVSAPVDDGQGLESDSEVDQSSLSLAVELTKTKKNQKKSIYDLIEDQRIEEDAILDKWNNYILELSDSDEIISKNQQLIITVRKRLMDDIASIHQSMLEETDWIKLERKRRIIKSLIQIRATLRSIVTDDVMDKYTSYNADSVMAATADAHLLYDRSRVHLYWLLQTSIYTIKDIFVSPVPLLETVFLVMIYLVLLRIFLRLAEKYFNSQKAPSGFLNRLLFQWGAVLYKRLAYWAFFHYCFVYIYKNYAWPEFEVAILVLNQVFFWFTISAGLRYWTLSKDNIKYIEKKSRDRILSLQRFVLIYLALISVKNELGEYLLGSGTLIAWIDQWLFIVLFLYAVLELRRFHALLMQSIKRYVRMQSKYRRLLELDGALKVVASMIAVVLLIYQAIESKIIFYIRRNENARKLMAYWSRQEITRLSEQESHPDQTLLSSNDAQCFDKNYTPGNFVDYGEKIIEQLNVLTHSDQRKFIALTGSRGLGKTTLLKRFMSESNDVDTNDESNRVDIKYIQCPHDQDSVYAAISKSLGVNDYQNSEQLLSVLKKYPKSVICLDDCQRLTVPSIGGLEFFESLVELMRKAGGQISWLMVFESPAWQFFSRVRGERLIFDKVIALPSWNEQQIQQLIHYRNKEAGIKPDFSQLFLPNQQTQDWLIEDEIDSSLIDSDHEDKPGPEVSLSELKEKALKARAQMKSYARVLWDFSGGNPQVTLWAWRRSLYREDDGEQIVVSLFQSMDQKELDSLPNLMLFVLKTILQMEQASVESISRATNLSEKETSDAVRFLSGRHYIEIQGGRYSISDAWLRPVGLLLTRQHLLEAV